MGGCPQGLYLGTSRSACPPTQAELHHHSGEQKKKASLLRAIKTGSETVRKLLGETQVGLLLSGPEQLQSMKSQGALGSSASGSAVMDSGSENTLDVSHSLVWG